MLERKPDTSPFVEFSVAIFRMTSFTSRQLVIKAVITEVLLVGIEDREDW